MKEILSVTLLLIAACAVADDVPPTSPSPAEVAENAEQPFVGSQEQTPTFEDVLVQMHRLRAEFDLEKRFRLEIQSMAAVNSESLRRLQRSLLVSARDHRESFSRVRVEQIRLEGMLQQQTDQTALIGNITNLQEDLQNMKTKMNDLEELVETAIAMTEAPRPIETVDGSKVENITRAVNELGVRLMAVEEHQILLQSLQEELENSFKSKLRRKIRSLKEDLESRIRDYNAAMTTFASDLRILRQEVERNVNSIKTTMAVENRKVSDSLHLMETAANQTKDVLRENLYYIARAQQEQMAHQTNLELEVEDMKEQTQGLLGILINMNGHLTNVTEMVTKMMDQPSHAAAGVVELQLEVLCPHPYIKSGSSCLSILPEHLTWSPAQQRCREMARTVGGEGDLATAVDDTHPIRSFVRKNVDLLPEESFVWVGASLSANNEWTWINGETLNHDLFPWGRSEPDPSVDQAFLCIKVSGGALFHNCLNSSALFAVCQLYSDPLVGKSITFAGLHRPRQQRPIGFSSDVSFADIAGLAEGASNNSTRT